VARRDLTNEEVEAMGLQEPGSAARYLEARREELEAEERQRLEREDEEEFVEQFVAAGGERSAAKAAYRSGRNENALVAAVLANDVAREQVRRGISQAL
jgi:hypothetical protein